MNSLLKPKAGYKQVKWWYGKKIEIPEDWEDRKIGDLIRFEGGSQPPRVDFVFQPTKGYVRMIQIRDFKTEHYQTYIPKNSTQKFFKKDDVMIGRYGPPNFQILRGLEGAYNVALMKTIPLEGIEKDYLFYFLNQRKLFEIMDSLAQRTAGQDGVELNVLKKLPFPLPPKKERLKIISILSTMDKIIYSTKKIIRDTELLKQGLMQKLLIKGINHKKFKRVKWIFNKEIEIPEKWEIVTLDSLTTLITNGFVGKATDFYTEPENGVRYVQGYNVKKNNFKFHGMKYVSHKFNEQHQKSCLKLGDLLTIQTGDVGTTTIVPSKLVGANCHALIISRFDKDIADPYFYCQYFNSEHCQKMFKMIEIGTTMKHLNGSDMKKLNFLRPPLKEQQKIASILTNMDYQIQSQIKYKEKLEKLKKSLMQKLLTGEVRVKV